MKNDMKYYLTALPNCAWSSKCKCCKVRRNKKYWKFPRQKYKRIIAQGEDKYEYEIEYC